MLCSLSVPALVALLVWKMWRVRMWVLLAVAYLTLMIPLFGIGIGGANILQMTLGGTIGGAVWISLFVYCQRTDRRRSEKALEVAEQNVGPNHPDVAGSLNNLALLYKTQGHYAQAEPLYKRALAIVEKSLGPDHPYVAVSLNNLAGNYRAMNRNDEAEPLEQRAARIEAIER